MTEVIQQEPILPSVLISSPIEAIDQLQVTGYILRGVSDALLALSEQSHDYQDAMRMFSDIALHQSQVVSQVEIVLERELRANQEPNGSSYQSAG